MVSYLTITIVGIVWLSRYRYCIVAGSLQGVCTLWYPGISIGDITRYIPWYYRYCWYSIDSYLLVYSLTYRYHPYIPSTLEESLTHTVPRG